ncbi:MAG: pyridoxamine 5'-phosphate oxidase [Candidatus Hydrogenedens sp.]
MIPAEDNPFKVFEQWYEEAKQKLDIEYAVSAGLATSTPDGNPDIRIVLVKQWDNDGFIFYTNYTSKKSLQIQTNPRAGLCFYWHELGKQIRIRGNVEKVEEEKSDQYFNSRDRLSQIGAWASKQSQILSNRYELKKRVAKYLTQFGISKVHRPPFWGGYRLIPLEIEFWQKKPYRLHERVLYFRNDIDFNNWERVNLYP